MSISVEEITSVGAVMFIREHIRSNNGEQGDNSPWFEFLLPFTENIGRVVSGLEGANYEVDPNGDILKVRAKFSEVHGESYWDMRRRLG